MLQRKSILLVVVIALVGVLTILGNSTPNGGKTNGEANGSLSGCPLLQYQGFPAGVEPLGVFDGAEVYGTDNGYVLRIENSTYSLNASSVFFFNWGFVVIENASEMGSVPFVKFSVDPYGRTNVSTGRLTSKVPVVVLRACTYDGKLLWNLTFSGYAWAYDSGKYGVKANGTALPALLVTNTSDYLYVLAYQTASRPYSEFRNYASDDYFYVLGRNGTVRKFNLERGFVPIRNVFLVSNGSYVLLGFERPQPDGSPMSGYVMIMNGAEVVWNRTFQMKYPDCLCHVISGWGRIDKKGCAVFGLYTGEGRYCNGKFSHVANTTG